MTGTDLIKFVNDELFPKLGSLVGGKGVEQRDIISAIFGGLSKLFKRDFAGDMLNMYKDLSLVKYGFYYHKDKQAPQDDLNWFLLKKK